MRHFLSPLSSLTFILAGMLFMPPDVLAVTETTSATTSKKLNGFQQTNKKNTIQMIKKEIPGLDVTPPTVKLTAPQGGGKVKGQAVLFEANASDKGGIDRVELYVEGKMVGAPIKNAPYAASFDSTQYADGGWIRLDAIAYDKAGNKGGDAAQALVENAPPADVTKPTITITNPKPGPVEGKFAVIAEATDDVGVDKVEFWVGPKPLGPGKFEQGAYWVHWESNLDADGPATVTATAYDKAGNSQTASVQVTVRNNYDKAAPTVSVTSPTANEELKGQINVKADAADDVGVDRVEFIGELGISLGTDNMAPYEVKWDTEATKTPDGPAMAMAVAYDKAGNKSESKVIFQLKNQNYHAVTIKPSPAENVPVHGIVQVELDIQPRNLVEMINVGAQGGKMTSIKMGDPTLCTWDLTGVPDGPASFNVEVRAAGGKIIGSGAFYYTVQNPKDEKAPQAAFISPSNGDTLSGNAMIEVEATDDVGMDWVNIHNGAEFFEQVKGPGPRYKATWNTANSKDGSYTITATAVDKSHNLKDIQINVKVENDGEAPTCEIAEPQDGAEVSGENVKVRVNASDNKGLDNVQIYPNYQQGPFPGVSLQNPPFETTFNSKEVQDGVIPIVAVAVDKSGRETKAQIKVKVLNNPYHQITFKVSPSENSTVRDVVTLSITCMPDDSKVDHVEIDGGAKKINGGNPFVYEWDTKGLANGQQSMTISAFHKDGTQIGAQTFFWDVQN